MEKFDKWNDIKKQISTYENRPNFSEREIWYCNLGLNIGDEQNGKGDKFLRPVVVFRKFNKKLFWAIPLTKNIKNSDYELSENCEIIKNLKTTISNYLYIEYRNYIKFLIKTNLQIIINTKLEIRYIII